MSFSGFTKPRFILCEGDDDKGVLEALVSAHNLPEFQICHSAECNPKQVGGKTGFSGAIKGMEALSGFRDLRAMLIVTDNDVLQTSFADAQRAFTENGHTAPAVPTAVGNMLGKPVAILMIPGHTVTGDLETLCLPAIHAKWPAAQACVNAFLNCTGANNWTKPASLSKARARSAAVGFYEPDPYKGIGHLFRNGTLSPLNNCFNDLVTFLRNFDAMCGI
jgi:hypothetical protein